MRLPTLTDDRAGVTPFPATLRLNHLVRVMCGGAATYEHAGARYIMLLFYWQP